MTDQPVTRYSQAVDAGLRPWFGNEAGPPVDFDPLGLVMRRDGTRGHHSIGSWVRSSRPRDHDIIGYTPARSRHRGSLGGFMPFSSQDYGDEAANSKFWWGVVNALLITACAFYLGYALFFAGV